MCHYREAFPSDGSINAKMIRKLDSQVRTKQPTVAMACAAMVMGREAGGHIVRQQKKKTQACAQIDMCVWHLARTEREPWLPLHPG